MKNIVFDIDGTIADCNHRLHYIENKPKNWKKFFDEMVYDKPIDSIIELLHFYIVSGYNIFIVTGRPESYRKETKKWLDDHHITYDELFMRPHGDYRPDYEVKEDVLNFLTEQGNRPDLVFEDRLPVVEMWRRNGVKCLQVE